MRILMFSDVYFPRINGVSTSIQTFREEFLTRGHEVVLVVPDYPHTWGDDPDIMRIPARGVVLDPEDRMMQARPIRDLAATLKARAFDICHIQTPFVAHYAGLAMARRLDLPQVESYHTFFEEYLYHYAPFVPRAWLRFAARRFSKWQCNAMDAIVVPSTAMLEHLRGYGVTIPARVLPTGIQPERFGRCEGSAFRQRHGIPPQRELLVFIGRVAHEKNIDFLLEVVARLKARRPGVLLVIAGEGPAESHLEGRVRALGIEDQVRFVGYLERERELPECYCAADAFVFASRTETQGLVLLEAMALGVPVVSTAVMGTRDILAAGRGALVPEDDVADFSRALERLLADPALRERLAGEAREHARQWSSGALAERMLEFYGETIEGRRRAGG